MDVDAFVAAHRAEWDRLDWLVRHRRRLSGTEIDELVSTYQRATTHLSQLRSAGHDPALTARLSAALARARAAIGGAHTPAWRSVGAFAAVSFPAMAYRLRWWWLGTAVISLAVALVSGWWIARSPAVQASLLTRSQTASLVNHQFRSYYSQYAATAFAFKVWTNNVWVAAEALIFGVLLGVPTLYVLLQNALNLGVDGGLLIGHGRATEFFALILPHGMLELSAVFLAAAAGLRLGWAIIDPGPRPRSRALAEEGPADDHHRHRPDRGAGRLGGDRGVRDAVAAADLGPHPDRGLRRGGLPGLRARARPPGAARGPVGRHRGGARLRAGGGLGPSGARVAAASACKRTVILWPRQG